MAEFDQPVSLTPEQQEIVILPPGTTALVTAGAGAGKTTTLTRRVDYLLRQGLSSQQILVLSFSRAAVARVQDGMSGLEQRPRTHTFDGWALDLLMQTDSKGGWLAEPFEARIQAATKAIRDEQADVILDDLAHVVIDEIQDLVGSRRQLVQALLGRFECGFTVVGDLAQSIYGFQVSDVAERATEVGAFVRWLRLVFGAELVELSLTQNFRAVTDEALSALTFGPRLQAMTASGDHEAGLTLYEDLRTTCLGFLELGKLDDPLVADLLATDALSSAVLCRTNGQALQLSDHLHRAGVAHHVKRDSRDRPAPAWITRLFSGGRRTLRHEDFQALTNDVHASPRMWRSLISVAPASGHRNVDLVTLAELIKQRRLPDDIASGPGATVAVSTYHRAKGLEFDRVILTDPGPAGRSDDGWDAAEEARLLYVGLTRARREILRLNEQWDWAVVRDPLSRRWARTGHRRHHRTGLEFGAGDVHSGDPAGTIGFADDPGSVQEYLAQHVSPGDGVSLELLSEEPGTMSPEYLVRHAHQPIGITSLGLGRDLHGWLRVSRNWVGSGYPSRIGSLRVDVVETVAGSPASGSLAGLGDLGVWLAPRLVGLGRLHYDTQGDSDD